MSWVATEAAARGAAFMDTHVPGWHNVIDVANLDLQHVGTCVLGQMYGHYETGAHALGFAPYGKYRDDDTAERYGFMACAESSYKTLTAAWRDEIARRRLAEWPGKVMLALPAPREAVTA